MTQESRTQEAAAQPDVALAPAQGELTAELALRRARHWLHLQPGWHRPPGLICHALHPTAARLLSPFVAGEGEPCRVSCSLQPLDTKSLRESLAAGTDFALSWSAERTEDWVMTRWHPCDTIGSGAVWETGAWCTPQNGRRVTCNNDKRSPRITNE